ncbi:MAG: hypothetical protein ACRENJ_06240 [Candidatus Eiseniibacteriota bacterium]
MDQRQATVVAGLVASELLRFEELTYAAAVKRAQGVGYEQPQDYVAGLLELVQYLRASLGVK